MNRDDIRKKLTLAITEQLDQLVPGNHCGAGTITESIEHTELRARIVSVDRLACEVELVTVTNPRLAAMSIEQLQTIASELSEQLSYLEERLVVLEIDRIHPQIQMRSDSPRIEDDQRSYFEVQVGKMGITLQRFAKQPSCQRVVVPAAVTCDIFLRVCVDLVAAVND